LPILTAKGIYVLVGGATDRFFKTMLLGPWLTKTRSKTVKCLASKPNQADLLTLKEMLEGGKISTVLDRTYPLSEVPTAIHQLEQRQVTGKIAIVI
jgi:NADPH:quinone reductase-like Zn-dependent oxidoreductase